MIAAGFQSATPRRPIVKPKPGDTNVATAPTTADDCSPSQSDHATTTADDAASIAHLQTISKVIVRKYDLHLIPLIFVAYTVFWLDRSNIALARFNGLERDLKLQDADFNTSLAVFFAMYILFNIPANLLLRKLGGGKFLPALIITWGIATTASGFVKDFTGLCVLRAAVGASEAGFLGAVLLWLGFFYTNEEIVSRIGILLSSAPLAGSIGGLLAGGLSRINVPGYRGWPWIFFIEGALTVVVGIVAAFVVPDTPEKAKFLTSEEKRAAKDRMVFLDRQSFARRIASTSNNSSKADVDKDKGYELPALSSNQESGITTQHRTDGNAKDKLQTVTWRRAILHPVTLLLTAGCFLTIESIYAYNLFVPTLLVEMGYRNVLNPLMTAPPNLVAFIYTIAITYYSQRTARVALPLAGSAGISAVGFLFLLIGSLAGGVRKDGSPNIVGPLQYVGTFLAGSGVSAATPLALSWTCVNAHPHYVRAIALGFMISIGNLATFLASFVYIKTNAPRYVFYVLRSPTYRVSSQGQGCGFLINVRNRYLSGHSINMVFNCLILVLTFFALAWMRRENRKREQGHRDKRLVVPEGVSAEEHERQLGWDHPRFRFHM